jgi:hypothetical protein
MKKESMLRVEIANALEHILLMKSLKYWRKIIVARKLRKFYAWFPNVLARHCVDLPVLADENSTNDEADLLLDRMEKFRPSRPWTLDSREGKMVFRFMSEDDAVMFKMQVS